MNVKLRRFKRKSIQVYLKSATSDTKQLLYILFIHRRFYTQTLLHMTLLHRRFYTQTLLHTDTFTHRNFYTRKLLHTLLHTDAFTHQRFYTQTLISCKKGCTGPVEIAVFLSFLTIDHHFEQRFAIGPSKSQFSRRF